MTKRILAKSRHRVGALLTLFAISSALAVPITGKLDESGWHEFELILLLNVEAETLRSEIWPLSPNVDYPAEWRWLKDPELLEALSIEYPTKIITASESGHIMIKPREKIIPESPSLNTQGTLIAIESPSNTRIDSLLQESIEVGSDEDLHAKPNQIIFENPTLMSKGSGASMINDNFFLENITEIQGYDRQKTSGPTIKSPQKEQESSPDSSPKSKLTDKEAVESKLLSLETLDLFSPAASQTFPEAVTVPFPEFVPKKSLIRLEPIKVSAKKIPSPPTFTKRPLNQLKSGLSEYVAQTQDSIVIKNSWLQEPNTINLPILIEGTTIADERYPTVQGFVKLNPAEQDFKMNVNFWVNTKGDYLPSVFSMPPPPASPSRITQLAEPLDLYPNALEWVELSSPQSTWQSADTNMAINQMQAVSVLKPWPWRHFINVTETLSLKENRVRYFDHPVIKIIAIWRELTWFELYSLGVDIREQ